MDKLFNYSWPGNVRELKNVIERAIVLSDAKDAIMPEHIQIETAAANYRGKTDDADFTYLFDSHLALNEIEEKYLKYLLHKNLSKSEIADITGISERNLYRKIASIK